MKKTTVFLLMLALTLSLCACSGKEPAPATTANPGSSGKTMKLASITSAKADSYEYVCETMFQDLVNKYTGGTIKAEYYPASQLGSSTELVEAVGLGTVQTTMGISYDIYANLEPKCMITCMPYAFRNYEHFKTFLETDNSIIHAVNNGLSDNCDILVLGYIYRAARVTITKDKGIYGPTDFSGMVIRSPESTVNVKWLESMGASPITITWSELYTSLSQGAAQGAENSITTIADANLQEIVDYCAETNHMMAINLITVNKTWFDGLSNDEQAAIRKAADEVTAYSWNAFLAAIDDAWKKFEDAGVICIRSDEIDFDAFQAASADVYKYFVAQGFFSEEEYQQLLSLAG